MQAIPDAPAAPSSSIIVSREATISTLLGTKGRAEWINNAANIREKAMHVLIANPSVPVVVDDASGRRFQYDRVQNQIVELARLTPAVTAQTSPAVTEVNAPLTPPASTETTSPTTVVAVASTVTEVVSSAVTVQVATTEVMSSPSVQQPSRGCCDTALRVMKWVVGIILSVALLYLAFLSGCRVYEHYRIAR